jgi:sigma-B regulation protein RsbU (phosphoserine phosphatase)
MMPEAPAGSSRTGPERAFRVLLVDDNPTNLQVLFQTLDGRGYELLVARTGEDALSVASRARPDLVLLDIMMPGIDGFETCRRLKADPETRESAVIFMSALGETKDKVRGLDLGAVDYITKPFQAEEVMARVDTHLTIQRLQQDLARRNAQLDEANRKMKGDLLAAAQVQQSLLPAALPQTDRARFAWEYRPCDDLAGDSLGVFTIDQRRVGLFVLDVTGHGVPAALLSVAATHILSRRDPQRSIIIRPGSGAGEISIVPPAEVTDRLNGLFPMAESANRFFTMVYGVLDLVDGRLRYAAAGHPGPLVLRADGSAESLDSTGIPIGIDPGATFEEVQIDLAPGDRFYLYSDGCFEEMNDGPLPESLATVITALTTWTGRDAFGDDVSLVAAEILTS